MNDPISAHTHSAFDSRTVRIGTRYRPSRLQHPYDALVIGSGIGGLTAAALLAQAGKRVLVLEQHYTAGGFTHAYRRKGYEWDVGVHYVGDMGGGAQARQIMDRLTQGRLQWAPMGDCYDRSFIGDEVFDFVAGKDRFVASLRERFPQDKTAIEKYVRLLDKIGRAMKLTSMAKLLPPGVYRWLKPVVSRLMPAAMHRTTYAVLRGLTANEQLIGILTTQWGDYGVPPRESCFMVHALVARHYLLGGYYPVGGASQIAAAILPTIQEGGGDVLTYARVQQILVADGKATGVRMKDGTVISAPLVISNAGAWNTFTKLLPAATSQALGYPALLDRVRPSCGHVCVYIGLQHDAKELALPKTNFWIFPDSRHDDNVAAFFQDPSRPFPAVYVSFPSAKDPSFAERYPGRATIEIVAPVAPQSFDAWADKPWGKRGEDYEALKEQVAQRLLAVLYDKLPQLKGKIDYYEVSTPLSTRYFCDYERGEMYGLRHDPERFSQSWLQVQTRLPGLYLTGQDVLSCGVVGAMMAGCLTAIKSLGRPGAKLAKELFGRHRHTRAESTPPMAESPT